MDEVERGGGNQITISNATEFTIFVEIYPIELVRRGNLRCLNLIKDGIQMA